jgi:hypothetical protein
MSDVFQLLANPVMFHALLKLFAIYAIFMAVTSALPTPDVTSSKVYIFVFRFFHALSMNFNRAAVALKVPGAQIEDQAKGQSAGG